jgi:hypothetical protein
MVNCYVSTNLEIVETMSSKNLNTWFGQSLIMGKRDPMKNPKTAQEKAGKAALENKANQKNPNNKKYKGKNK